MSKANPEGFTTEWVLCKSLVQRANAVRPYDCRISPIKKCRGRLRHIGPPEPPNGCCARSHCHGGSKRPPYAHRTGAFVGASIARPNGCRQGTCCHGRLITAPTIAEYLPSKNVGTPVLACPKLIICSPYPDGHAARGVPTPAQWLRYGKNKTKRENKGQARCSLFFCEVFAGAKVKFVPEHK